MKLVHFISVAYCGVFAIVNFFLCDFYSNVSIHYSGIKWQNSLLEDSRLDSYAWKSSQFVHFSDKHMIWIWNLYLLKHQTCVQQPTSGHQNCGSWSLLRVRLMFIIRNFCWKDILDNLLSVQKCKTILFNDNTI